MKTKIAVAASILIFQRKRCTAVSSASPVSFGNSIFKHHIIAVFCRRTASLSHFISIFLKKSAV
ncbi:hypothetical protein DDV21_008660 [Streptococcus chenjunshii]|uniref:Uncharacterized protein n=1 Tax=Streptococcus chenjunshii TaxID=2173853 RepID=A0A372KN85_9STRE|nr:hypothetical protein DDV21_008660 [Streptococcus chenjunshii]RFU50982.1 hypothetical protein DDV22_05805 [Streptococcus chenjunshii]RFU53374.1 hypothetical protein DDV23_04945 [Streptococcus chenjunshii]